MISMMDMTTGVWEKECTAPDDRLLSGVSTPHRDADRMAPQPLAGLCEYEQMRPLHDGMPVEVAMQDVDEFLCRMSAYVN